MVEIFYCWPDSSVTHATPRLAIGHAGARSPAPRPAARDRPAARRADRTNELQPAIPPCGPGGRRVCGPRGTSGAAGDGRRRAPAPGRARASRQKRAVRAGSLPSRSRLDQRPLAPGPRVLRVQPPFSRLTVSFDIMLHMHIAALADRYGIYGALKQRAQSHCGLTPHARSHPPPRAAPQPHRDRRGALPRAATSWS